LEELISECFKHLKPKGELLLVVKKNVKPFMERTIKNKFGNCDVLAQGREHVVLKAILP